MSMFDQTRFVGPYFPRRDAAQAVGRYRQAWRNWSDDEAAEAERLAAIPGLDQAQVELLLQHHETRVVSRGFHHMLSGELPLLAMDDRNATARVIAYRLTREPGCPSAAAECARGSLLFGLAGMWRHVDRLHEWAAACGIDQATVDAWIADPLPLEHAAEAALLAEMERVHGERAVREVAALARERAGLQEIQSRAAAAAVIVREKEDAVRSAAGEADWNAWRASTGAAYSGLSEAQWKAERLAYRAAEDEWVLLASEQRFADAQAHRLALIEEARAAVRSLSDVLARREIIRAHIARHASAVDPGWIGPIPAIPVEPDTVAAFSCGEVAATRPAWGGYLPCRQPDGRWGADGTATVLRHDDHGWWVQRPQHTTRLRRAVVIAADALRDGAPIPSGITAEEEAQARSLVDAGTPAWRWAAADAWGRADEERTRCLAETPTAERW